MQAKGRHGVRDLREQYVAKATVDGTLGSCGEKGGGEEQKQVESVSIATLS